MRDDIPYLSEQTTDVPVRGCLRLRDGRTALVLNEGRVLVCKDPQLLSEHASRSLLHQWELTNQATATGLAAISNLNGPSTEQTLRARREKTQRQRDRKTIVIDDQDVPTFTESALGLGITDLERKARTEAIRREVPDV